VLDKEFRMPDRPDTTAVEEQLGKELLRLHRESYGRGAGESRVYLHDDLVVCLLDEIELLPNEQFLIDNGDADGVLDVRTRYQQAIETTFRAAVERITGRRTVSFVSTTKLDPNYAVEIFRLGEPQEIPLEEPGDA
jgi:uncharacterized protein YbcI